MKVVKTCRACGEQKPLTEFHARRDTGSTQSYCKSCSVERRREWEKDAPARAAAELDYLRQFNEQQRHAWRERIRSSRALARSTAHWPKTQRALAEIQEGL